MKFRQNLTMEQSRVPELMGKALNSLEQRAHPFFGTGSGPKQWCQDLDVPVFDIPGNRLSAVDRLLGHL